MHLTALSDTHCVLSPVEADKVTLRCILFHKRPMASYETFLRFETLEKGIFKEKNATEHY